MPARVSCFVGAKSSLASLHKGLNSGLRVPFSRSVELFPIVKAYSAGETSRTHSHVRASPCEFHSPRNGRPHPLNSGSMKLSSRHVTGGNFPLFTQEHRNPRTPPEAKSTAAGEASFLAQEYSEYLEAAIEAVGRACALALQVRREFSLEGTGEGGLGAAQNDKRVTVQKQDKTPVTVADYAIQALITLELQRLFPDAPLLGEEDTSDLLRHKRSAEQEASLEGSLLPRVVSLVQEFASARVRGSVCSEKIISALGEKKMGEGRGALYWVLDPIDGTLGFLRGGIAQYVIGLALVEGNDVIAGVMGLPNLPSSPNLDSTGTFRPDVPSRGLLIAAIKGGGCWVSPISSPHPQETEENMPRGTPSVVDNSKGGLQRTTLEVLPGRGEGGVPWVPCHVDGVPRVREGVVCISDHEMWEGLPLARGLEVVSGEGSSEHPGVAHLCCGSLCKYAAVALGRASVFIQHPISGPENHLKVWDHAAGVICVMESGGKVTDFGGRDLKLGHQKRTFVPTGGGVVVTNGQVHKEVLQCLRLGLS